MLSTLVYVAFGLLLLLSIVRHVRRTNRKDDAARAAAERGKLHSEGPRAQHPHIDATHCIGCGACVEVCPEGDVLAVLAGKAAIVNGHKCIGHGLCAEVCPVGAITIVMASPSVGADMPQLTPEHETNIPNLFIAGELGGLALIKNAVNEGRDCIDLIGRRLFSIKRGRAVPGAVDVCIVGAGPAGISASLRAIEKKLSYVTLEQDVFGGTVAKYPRQKIVMTSPVEFPLHGKFTKLQISKEEIIKFWQKLHGRAGLKVNTQEKVERIGQEPDGTFIIESAAYTDAHILVVGGGDSAVEAAMGLAHQRGNRVTLSYRREAFSRIKERNAQKLPEYTKSGRLQVIFNSQPVAIAEKSVRLEVAGTVREIPNDYVWVFAGGTPPSEFLKACGVQIGPQDLTLLTRDIQLAG